MENRIIIDWLSFTSKIHSPSEIIKLLGMESVTWETIKGACGYKDRLYFSNISIHFNGSEEMGVWCELSGRGCRCYEDFGSGDYDTLFATILSDPDVMKITRLDIAYDDFQEILPIKKIAADTLKESFVSKWQKYEVIYASQGTTINHGSRRSESMMRIYDKAAEQEVEFPWIRLELQLRDDRATAFAKSLQLNAFGIGYLFLSVINNYIRYVKPSLTDSNKWRWPNLPYWQKFIADADKIQLYEKPGMDYTILNLESFVIGQAGNAIKTYIELVGMDVFMEELKNSNFRRNVKYETLKQIYPSIGLDAQIPYTQGLIQNN